MTEIRIIRLLLIAAGVLLAGEMHARAESGPPAAVQVLLTADTAGHLHPCMTCPQQQGLGGLARRATLVQEIRQGQPILLLDAGNALIGTETAARDGSAIVAAYNAIGYDAINLSYRDFRRGKQATLDALASATFEVLSANLLDEQTGEPLARPYIVKEIGGRRIAVIGASDAPAALAVLPHLKQQLAGVRVDPPEQALQKWLPAARAEADRVILLYYGSGAGARRVRDQFNGQIDLMLVGGERPDFLPQSGGAEAAAPVVGTHHHGTHVAHVRMSDQVGSLKVESDQLRVGAALQPDEAMQKLLADHAAPMLGLDGAGVVHRPRPMLPALLEPGETYRLGSTAENRALRLTVLSARAGSEVAGRPASPGKQLLVLDTEWENIIPLALVLGQDLPTMVRAENLADHFYLVLNGNRLVRLPPDASRWPGHLPVSPFVLPEMGSAARGNMVFEIPVEGVESLELRLYEYAHGSFALPLMRRDDGKEIEAPPPVGDLASNELLEAGVFGVERAKEVGGEKAPEGMEFVLLEFRARSLFRMEGDATAFDPHAEAGTKIQIGSVGDWADWRDSTRLLADGQSFPPHELTELPEEPRFLPDLVTGGVMVFVVPAGARQLELHCAFPNALVPGRGLIHPAPLHFVLAGGEPAAEAAGPPDSPPRPVRRLIVPDAAPLE